MEEEAEVTTTQQHPLFDEAAIVAIFQLGPHKPIDLKDKDALELSVPNTCYNVQQLLQQLSKIPPFNKTGEAHFLGGDLGAAYRYAVMTDAIPPHEGCPIPRCTYVMKYEKTINGFMPRQRVTDEKKRFWINVLDKFIRDSRCPEVCVASDCPDDGFELAPHGRRWSLHTSDQYEVPFTLTVFHTNVPINEPRPNVSWWTDVNKPRDKETIFCKPLVTRWFLCQNVYHVAIVTLPMAQDGWIALGLNAVTSINQAEALFEKLGDIVAKSQIHAADLTVNSFVAPAHDPYHLIGLMAVSKKDTGGSRKELIYSTEMKAYAHSLAESVTNPICRGIKGEHCLANGVWKEGIESVLRKAFMRGALKGG